MTLRDAFDEGIKQAGLRFKIAASPVQKASIPKPMTPTTSPTVTGTTSSPVPPPVKPGTAPIPGNQPANMATM